MATFPKAGLAVNAQDDPVFSYLLRYWPETASETFPAGSPIVLTSGFVAEAADPATSIAGIALTAGQNNASNGGVNTEVVMALPNLVLEANLLEAAAANHTLADSDLGDDGDLAKSSTLIGGADPGWHFETPDGGTPCVRFMEFDSMYVAPDRNDYKPVSGDVNARIRARILSGVSVWY